MSQETLKELQTGITKLARTNKDMVRAMMNLSETAAREGALPRKMKKLIFVALAVQQRCSYCISHHVHDALESGATAEEIYEAAEVAVAMGGGPSLAYTATLVREAVESFAQNG
ncbi:carboxymuconolactone decarboxylase family protein [Desulfovermiculus halophilus]|jgi:AhpD family alkylhydroperoxidase|uniref:carboxymuconolactone decarboxylase family protein n=1 Tax=Desulfovermiculus halophilus TaxID=339722 RepID=UPI000482658C|nr:carboxymuconolactone decarboxylase family protein [Desulfovermiculus halophilus]